MREGFGKDAGLETFQRFSSSDLKAARKLPDITIYHLPTNSCTNPHLIIICCVWIYWETAPHECPFNFMCFQMWCQGVNQHDKICEETNQTLYCHLYEYDEAKLWVVPVCLSCPQHWVLSNKNLTMAHMFPMCIMSLEKLGWRMVPIFFWSHPYAQLLFIHWHEESLEWRTVLVDSRITSISFNLASWGDRFEPAGSHRK